MAKQKDSILVQMVTEYTKLVEKGKQEFFAIVIRNFPHATISDISDFADETEFSDLEIRTFFSKEIPADKMPGSQPEAEEKEPSPPPPDPPPPLPTPPDKKAPNGYADRIHNFLVNEGGYHSSRRIREKIGGERLEAKKCLNELCKTGRVVTKGEAAGKQYKAADT